MNLPYYWSRLYTEDLEEGEDFEEAPPAYSLIFTTVACSSTILHQVTPLSLLEKVTAEIVRTDFLSVLLYSRLANAKKEGIDKGIGKGMVKGGKEGMEKGMAKTALNMLKEGFKLSMISKITGLTEEKN